MRKINIEIYDFVGFSIGVPRATNVSRETQSYAARNGNLTKRTPPTSQIFIN